jgi:hypothetical protein
MKRRAGAHVAGLAAVLGTMTLSTHAWAWGHTGDVQISRLAVQHLPDDLPAFVRSPGAAEKVGEFGAEPDLSKTTGVVTGIGAGGRINTARTAHDQERDPGHYVDIDDQGFVQGGAVKLSDLPPTREAYDTAQRTATNPPNQTQYTAGYLPYAIIDGFQQVRKDFAIWRALEAGLRTAADDSDRGWFAYQLGLREELTLRDIGYWSHFVADGSQPMHVSIHFNSWGEHPNPRGFTTAPIHAPFEGAFVRKFVDFGAVAAAIPAFHDCQCTIEQRVPQYLAQTLSQLVPVYEAADTDLYTSAQPAELAIVTQQLAAGAAELRDQIVDAWRQSAEITVGFPLVKASDVLSGAVKVTPQTFEAD